MKIVDKNDSKARQFLSHIKVKLEIKKKSFH